VVKTDGRCRRREEVGKQKVTAGGKDWQTMPEETRLAGGRLVTAAGDSRWWKLTDDKLGLKLKKGLLGPINQKKWSSFFFFFFFFFFSKTKKRSEAYFSCFQVGAPNPTCASYTWFDPHILLLVSLFIYFFHGLNSGVVRCTIRLVNLADLGSDLVWTSAEELVSMADGHDMV
jgi:hypothetical protein